MQLPNATPYHVSCVTFFLILGALLLSFSAKVLVHRPFPSLAGIISRRCIVIVVF